MSKRVEFDVVANTKQAQQGFQQLDQQLAKNTKGLTVYQQRQRQANISAMSFMRIAQDSPFFMTSMSMGIMSVSNNIPMFVESMERAKNASGSWMKAIAMTGKQLLTVPNLLMLAVSAVTAYSIWAGNAAREQKKLNSALEGMVKVGGKPEALELDLNDAQSYLSTLNKMKEDMAKGTLTNEAYKDFTPLERLEQRERQLSWNAQAEAKNKLELESIRNKIKDLNIINQLIEATEKQTKAIELQLQAVQLRDRAAGKGKGRGGVPNLAHPEMGFDGGEFEDFTIEDSDGGSWRQDQLDEIIKNYERAARERQKMFDKVFIQPAGESFSAVMNEAWNGVFGHANSLLEIFLNRFAQGLIDVAAENLASSLFSFIPGVGGLLDMIFKPSVGGAGGTTANAQYAQRLNI